MGPVGTPTTRLLYPTLKVAVPRVYTLQVLLPEQVQEQLREWTVRTPGATLPAGGAHITLLSPFSPVRPRAPIRKFTATVCATFLPFPVRLSRVLSGTHWRRPSLNGVFLMGNGLTEGIRELVRLQRALRETLDPLKRDLHPEVSRRPYKPHVSLTWGIPPGEAVALARSARAARLQIEFTVDRIWLVEYPPESSGSGEVTHVRSFKLG